LSQILFGAVVGAADLSFGIKSLMMIPQISAVQT